MIAVVSQYEKILRTFTTKDDSITEDIRDRATAIAKQLRGRDLLERGYYNIFLIDLPLEEITDLSSATVDRATVDSTVEHIW